MKVRDLLKQTWTGIAHNKARSFLTILGIVIGIASVIVMLSIGQGAQSSVQDSINSIGTDLLTISPGAANDSSGLSQGQGTAETLTSDDVDLLNKYLPFLEGVAPIDSSQVQAVITGGTNTNVSIYGINMDYLTVKDLEMMQGNFFGEQEVEALSKNIVLGYQVYVDLFGEGTTNVLGQKVQIDEMDFTIVGVVDEIGSRSDDSLIYAPITTVQHYISGTNYYSSILVKVGSDENVPIAKEMVENIMRISHGIVNEDDDDFSVSEPTSFLETASSITEIFTLLLASVAGISLLVGGIGIMNMMLTTVSERTKEIGIRKSLGATESEISLQFLTDSVVLTLLGGIFGLGIGFGISELITQLGLIDTVITSTSVILAVGVSSFIGIVFGYYPAKRAAHLDPIEALRHE